MIRTLSDEQLGIIHENVRKRVRVSCCEHHAHSALDECLDGDERDITICKLIEVIRRERMIVRNAVAAIGNP